MNSKKLWLIALTIGAFAFAAVPESKAGVSVGIGIGGRGGYGYGCGPYGYYPYGYYPYGYRYGYRHRARFRPVVYITNRRHWYRHRGHRVYVSGRRW
jgi:hypothetical protein